MNAIRSASCAAALLLGLAAAGAHAQAPAVPGSALPSGDEIDARHRSDLKRCEGLNGADKDVCEKQADAQRDSARADLRQARKEAEARRDAQKEKRDAGYDLAKAKCDALSGDAKDACVADVKTRFGK